MSVLTEDLKNGRMAKIYLLYGPDAYQRNRYRDAVNGLLCKDLDSMNINRYQGKDIEISEVIGIAETLPFFADRRVIIIENSEWFGAGKGEELADYLENLSETTHIVFVEEQVDKRSRLFKLCQKNGTCECCEILKGPELEKWVLTLLTREKKRITGDGLRLFLEKTDSDMNNMRMELEKLISYMGERTDILPEDVEAICHTRTTSKIFDLVEAIARKSGVRALEIYREMIELRESPNLILYLVARQFHLILMAFELRGKGLDKYKMAEKMGVQPFVADKAIAQMRGFTKESVRQALEECVEMDQAIKSGRMDSMIGVETILVKWSRT